MIKVIIIDDHPIVLDGLKILLSNRDDMMLAGSFDNGKEGLAAVLEQQPHVVLLDINLPEIDGTAICKHSGNRTKTFVSSALSVHNGWMVLRTCSTAEPMDKY